MDSSYVNWLIEHASETIFELFDINYWTDVYDNRHNIIPNDGLYVLAFRDDNHISYKIEYFIAGTNIQNHYPLDGKKLDWFHCLAYRYIPKFSMADKWRYHVSSDLFYSILAINDATSQVKYIWDNMLFDYSIDSIDDFPPCCYFEKNENGKYCLFDEGCIDNYWNMNFLGEFIFGRYSESHHRNHNNFYKLLFETNN